MMSAEVVGSILMRAPVETLMLTKESAIVDVVVLQLVVVESTGMYGSPVVLKLA